MENKELVIFAAKAAGVKLLKESPWFHYSETGGFYQLNDDGSKVDWRWNPLNDDGDALRLAVRLEMLLDLAQHGENTFDHLGLRAKVICHNTKDPMQATRRAIVRAAAEIGKGM